MSKLSYQIMAKRQQTATKIYGFLCLVLAAALGYYIFTGVTAYSSAKASLNDAFVESLKDEAAEGAAAYEKVKDDFEGLNEDISEGLATVFPASDQYTELTRQLDAFEKELDTSFDPFEVSNIDFQGVREEDNFKILPLRMNIRSSRKNFFKFLALVESSGSLDDAVRLMELTSIRLNFEQSGSDDDDPLKKQIINFTVQIDAYFQKS